MIKSVVITFQRTGSTFLVRSLDHNDNVLFSGELLHHGNGVHNEHYKFPDIVRTRSRFFNQVCKLLLFNVYTFIFINRYYRKARDNHQIVGFKLMLSHLFFAPVIFLYLFANKHIRIIFLTRSNTFDCAMSRYFARKTGFYHSWEGEVDNLINHKINVFIFALTFFKVFINNIIIKIMSRCYRRSILIDYNDLTNINRLFYNLGLSLGTRLEANIPSQKRQNIHEKYRLHFSNYYYIHRLFAGDTALIK